jgi:predicted ATP-dependent endonuclease of OLD family
MRLTKIRVQMFQNIIDSGVVEIESDVTCLVGKNESGKTAVLRAMYRLNPAYSGADAVFDPREDYPRWLWKKHEKEGTVKDRQPIWATFVLDDDDVVAIEQGLGEGVIASREIQVWKTYENEFGTDLRINEDAIVREITAAIPQPNPQRFEAFPPTLKELGTAIAALPGRPRELNEETGEEIQVAADISEFYDAVDALSAQLKDLSAELPRVRAWKRFHDRMPEFFFFSEYSNLPGRVALGKLLNTSEEVRTAEQQTAMSLLQLAGGQEADLTAEDYERRVAELEAAANEITRQVFEYWSQNKQLRVSFDVDKQIENNPNGDPRVVERYLDIRLHDQRHLFTTNFSTRSSGFRWFFSFIAAFSEFEGSDRVVVLLDEPALALHARAQADFLRFINERLAPEHQVIYTTHSAFMIEPQQLRRVRLVEDHAEEGGHVSRDVLASDRDTLFPLQAALGYDIAQNLFIGTNNLVVEGTSDFIYLSELARHLAESGRPTLDLGAWTIVPVGGASKVPTFVALLGAHAAITVLVDSEAKLNQDLTSMITRGLLDKEKLLTVGRVTGSVKADIEDLFAPDEYLLLYNEAFGSDLSMADLPGKDPIVKRIEKKTKSTFNHGKPAEVLMRRRESFLPALSDETLQRFEQLFKLVDGEETAPV